jgi:hypothetical protein
MEHVMNCARDRRTPVYRTPMQETVRSGSGHKPMHTDDYAALLAWVTAKRCHEMCRKETGARKTARSYIVG